jgi:membrane protein implicated in regulation of membrane protease activity
MNTKLISGLAVLLFGALACRPVIAMGWQEFLLFFVLLAFLLGPPLYRFLQRIETPRRHQKKDKSQKDKETGG